MNLGIVILLTTSALAQAPARLSFEVASIKPAAPFEGRGSGGPMRVRMGMTQDAGRVNIQGLPLSAIISRAYDLKSYQLSGPDWINSIRFDIVAKMPDGAKEGQVPEMLQTLLEDRFQLKFHREPKEIPVYVMVVGKNGIKMKATVEESGEIGGGKGANPKAIKFQPGHFDIKQISLADLANFIGAFVDRPVMDQTDTKGNFEVKLDFAMDMGMMGRGMGAKVGAMRGPGTSAGGGGDAPEAPEGPSIFSAMQDQLGLKLEPKKAPVDVLVIDHMEKMPTEN